MLIVDRRLYCNAPSKLLVGGRYHCCLDALNSDSAEVAELSLSRLAASRTSNNCSHSPIAHSHPPQHLRPLHSQPQCVPLLLAASRTLPSARREPLRPTRDHRHDHREPSSTTANTHNTACPTSRVFTARTTFLRGRGSTRTTTVSGSGRRWVDRYTSVRGKSKDIGDTGTSRTRTEHPVRKSKRLTKDCTTGPSRQDHALPLLRHFDRYQRRYVLESVNKSGALQRLTSTQPPCT